MGLKVYLNGEIIEQEQAQVSVSNPAFLHGVGLFETLAAYNGRAFKLDEHLERMKQSAKKLDMPLDECIDQASGAIEQLLQANQLTNARIRITVTPPSPQDEEGGNTLLIAARESTGYPEELYQKGLTVMLCTDYRQSPHDPLAGHKTTSYFPRLIALRNAQNKQCGEALWFTPQNFLAEACMSNVFLVKNGKLRTPSLELPILPGVTRATVLELAKGNNIPVSEESCLTVDDLLDSDEVFLTNSIMQVLPVTRVERKAIGREKPGEVTNTLLKAYRRLIETC
jgi:branched-chain amino acid aminotransferase